MKGGRGLLWGAALVAALAPGRAAAMTPAQDFLQAFHRALFGVSSSPVASHAPFRTWFRDAFQVPRLALDATQGIDLQVPALRLRLTLAPVAISETAAPRRLLSPLRLHAGLPAPTSRLVSAAPPAFDSIDLMPGGVPAVNALPQVAAGGAPPHEPGVSFVPPLLLVGGSLSGVHLSAPARLGPLRMTGSAERFEATGIQPLSSLLPFSPPISARTEGTLLGSTLTLPVGRRPLALDLVSGDERVLREDAFMEAHSLNAGLDVPVGAFTLGVRYGTQHLQGADLLTGTPYDARNDLYLGRLEYRLPSGNALTLTARQQRYQDNLASGAAFAQAAANLDFTIKF